MTIAELQKNYKDKKLSWDGYLAEKYKHFDDIELFSFLQKRSIYKYMDVFRDWTSEKITLKQYIPARKEGITYYMHRLHHLLGSDLMPDSRVDYFCWKGLKEELVTVYPEMPIKWGRNMTKRELVGTSAGKTIRIALEAFDEYNRDYVKLKNWRLRFLENAECPKERDGYNSKDYSDVVVTPQEKAQYERWRDGRN